MYIMDCIRPDLSFAVNLSSSYIKTNNKIVRKYFKVVLKCENGTSNLKLVYRQNSNKISETLTGYVNFDLADEKTTKKSSTGFLFNFIINALSESSVQWPLLPLMLRLRPYSKLQERHRV